MQGMGYTINLKFKQKQMNVKIEDSWKEQLAEEFEKDYFVRLTDFVREEYKTGTIYPP